MMARPNDSLTSTCTQTNWVAWSGSGGFAVTRRHSWPQREAYDGSRAGAEMAPRGSGATPPSRDLS
jgi:hypothetical protein